MSTNSSFCYSRQLELNVFVFDCSGKEIIGLDSLYAVKSEAMCNTLATSYSPHATFYHCLLIATVK